MPVKLPVATAAIIAATGLCSSALAEPMAKDVAKYRESVMEAMAGHMAALSLIVTNKVDAAQHLKGHADALASAGQELEILFPAGSDVDDSEALPAIWERPEEFADAVRQARDATAALQKVADTDDSRAVLTAFKDVGNACKNCHESFREDD